MFFAVLLPSMVLPGVSPPRFREMAATPVKVIFGLLATMYAEYHRISVGGTV